MCSIIDNILKVYDGLMCDIRLCMPVDAIVVLGLSASRCTAMCTQHDDAHDHYLYIIFWHIFQLRAFPSAPCPKKINP